MFSLGLSLRNSFGALNLGFRLGLVLDFRFSLRFGEWFTERFRVS